MQAATTAFSLLAAGLLALLPGTGLGASLFEGVRSNDILQVSEILNGLTPAEVNKPLMGGVTPLHVAAAMDNTEIVALLLSRGADINAQTSGGFTPLHWAAGKDALHTTMYLVDSGANVNTRAANGITPLHWAAYKNMTNVVRYLVRSGADISAKTQAGLQPLHWALRKESGDAAEFLAYKQVSAEMANPLPSELEQYMEIPPEGIPPLETPVPAPQTLRAAAGKTLTVPLGFGETLEFVWIKSLKIWFGKFEVTNGQFRRFNLKHASPERDGLGLDGTDQPAVTVSWKDADAFCQWLNKHLVDRIPRDCQFRLPTDEEWMIVAKCGDDRKYPWGNAWPPAYGNYSDLSARRNLSDWSGIRGYEDSFAVTCPVTQSGENEWGVFGLAGNVWEWCQDWSDSSETYKIRHGGSWDFDQEASLRITARGLDRIDARYDTIGIRLVVAPKPPQE